jgi:surface polysaccharide O-acyltransferase-like enzyme
MEGIVDKKRIYYLDVIRVVACLCVVMIHASELSISNGYTTSSLIISGALDSISRIGVPLFFMISGALFLDEAKKLDNKKLIHKIFRLILIFSVWTIISLLTVNYNNYIVPNIRPLHLGELLNHFISGYPVLWFLEAIVGLYLLTPILKLWVNKKNKKYVEYYLILSIIISIVIPTICYYGGHYYEIFNTINSHLHYFNISNMFITYYVLGWYLHNYSFEKRKLLYLFSIIGIILSVILFSYYIKKYDNYLDIFNIFQISIFIQSVATFLFFKNIVYKKERKIVNTISKYSLGIYVSHVIIILSLYDLRTHIPFIFSHYPLWISFLYISSFLLSLLITFIINKIPILKKIVSL